MDKSNYISELDRLSQQLQGSPDKQKPSLKRKIDDISQNGHYEDINKELRELYMARRQLRENNSSTNDTTNTIQSKDSEKTFIDLSNHLKTNKAETIIIDKNVKPRIVEDVNREREILEKWETITEPVSTASKIETKATNNDPILWINKLRHYPSDFLLSNMITFKQLMYEDLLKGGKDSAYWYSLNIIY